MMTKFGVECAITLSDTPWASGGNEETIEKDRTESIIADFFPEINLIKGTFHHHQDSFNNGINQLQHCDLIFVTDCDMFITQEDWGKMIDWILDEWPNHDGFAIAFQNMIQEYYYDHHYGKAATPGGEPPFLAVKKGIHMRHMTDAYGVMPIVWDVEGPKFHHMRYCKPSGSGAHRCRKPTKENSNMDDYTPVPKEIINLLEKWEKKIESL
jgi:hypothetical protein